MRVATRLSSPKSRHEMPGRCQRKRPSQRDGMIGSANGAFLIWGMIEPRYEIILSLTGRIRCCAHSRHFMPGYPHSVPPGRKNPRFSNSLLGRIRRTLVAAELRLFHQGRGTRNIRSLISCFASRN